MYYYQYVYIPLCMNKMSTYYNGIPLLSTSNIKFKTVYNF